MPRVAKEQVQPHELYGKIKVDNSLTMGERIRKRFKPTDTVKVQNITNQECTWQWMDEADESYAIEDDTNIKIMDREDPGLWRLGAGEFDVLLGACAYLMIEALYKQVCVMKTGIVLHPLDEREVRNFSLDDPEKQEMFIDAVFKGKVTPIMMQQAALSQIPGGNEGQILEHLAPLPTEESEYRRRHAGESHIVNRPTPTNLEDLKEEFDPNAEPLGGRATGALPADRQLPPEPPQQSAPAPAAPKEPVDDDPGQDEQPPKQPVKEPAKPAVAAPTAPKKEPAPAKA